MRSLNARITEHVRVTGDKSGGAEMTLTMIDLVFDKFWEMLNAQGANCANFSPKPFTEPNVAAFLQKV